MSFPAQNSIPQRNFHSGIVLNMMIPSLLIKNGFLLNPKKPIFTFYFCAKRLASLLTSFLPFIHMRERERERENVIVNHKSRITVTHSSKSSSSIKEHIFVRLNMKCCVCFVLWGRHEYDNNQKKKKKKNERLA